MSAAARRAGEIRFAEIKGTKDKGHERRYATSE
jgi:hypothetical protein